MNERFKSEGAGKGAKSRVTDINKFSRNMEKLYERKTWEFWSAWLGLHIDEIDFDDSGLEVGQQISYNEYIKRLKNES